MTFQESEVIYTAADIALDLCRDKFLAAYEAFKAAGLLIQDGHIYTAEEVEIGNNYRSAMHEFAFAVDYQQKSEQQWLKCMNAEDDPRDHQWN